MKKSIIIAGLVIALHLTSYAQNNLPEQGFIITLTAENAGKGMIYLSSRSGSMLTDLDSVRASVFPATLKGKLNAPEMLYLRVSGSNVMVPVFTENSNITVTTDFDEPGSTKVEGSAIHKEFDDYTAGLSVITASQSELVEEWRTAQKEKNETKLVLLEKKFEELDKAEGDYNRNYVQNHSASFLSPFIIRRSLFYSLELDELKNIVGSLDQKVDQSVYTIDLKERIKVLEKVAIGMKYTDIQLPAVDGGIMKLSDFTGKNIVLVDFWASWCGPCRRENPNVVKVYREYKDKGFDIVGVSFDTSGEKWREAIQADSLTWHHMSDLNGWNSKAAGIYGVSSIPHTVLIDRDGTIIAKNLRADALKARLSELLD